ncbi:MAG: T9SS type A sorting domain-containing protein [Crocinitomicaceae bacterium]|nr:T9SS type A sorting domain-containing protein [Crocinitomicaceae bacterium]
MKTTILLSIFLLPSILLGQVINHFGNLDSKWNVAKSYPSGNQQNPNFVATITKVYGFQGDTLIDSEQWFKLYSSSDSLFESNLLYLGLLREENNKVFYLDTLNQLDTLYDFSLNVGDSVLFDLYGMYPEWLQVVNVDSVQISGDYYKRLKFAEPTINAFDELNEIWIEGIGSIHGPLFPSFPIKFSQEIPDSMLVTCTFSNNQQVWQHQSYPSCYVKVVLSVDQMEILNFKIYPNPFTDRIHFENNGLQQYRLTVLNSLGQTIHKIQANTNNRIIDLSDFQAGIYFLKIESGDNIKTIKMIKKH